MAHKDQTPEEWAANAYGKMILAALGAYGLIVILVTVWSE